MDCGEESLTRTLAAFACEGSGAAMRPVAAMLLLDTLGCAIAGLNTQAGRIAVAHCGHERSAIEGSLVSSGPVSATAAAFGNCLLANAIDSDAFGPEGHMAAVVIPAALAIAEARQASGAELLDAIAIGMEIGGRLGAAMRRMAVSPQPLTGHTFAVIGAVASAGRLLAFDEERMCNAFGIAGYSAQLPSLRRFFSRNQDAMTKYDHLALSARNGVDAALLAQRGFTGDRAILDGEYPFWRLSGAEGMDSAWLLNGLGAEWRLADVRCKPYPVGIGGGPIIDSALQALAESGAAIDAIERIEVFTATPYVHKPMRAPSVIEAWADVRYGLCMALLGVRPRSYWYDPAQMARADVAALMQRVSIGALEGGASRWAARVRLHVGGNVFEAARDDAAPMNEESLREKFFDNASIALSKEDASHLAALCESAERLRDIRSIGALLAKARP